MASKRWLRVLTPVLVALVLVVMAWLWLGAYTRHDAHEEVPDLKGLTLEEAMARTDGRDLHVEVIDSVYNDDVPKGTVTDQDPDAGKVVKPGRTIYLVMNAREHKMLNMPALVDLSKRQAISVLEILGLKVGEVQYRPDPCLDCVVGQLYKGQPIAAETRIRRGEVVTLVLGSGAGGTRVQVPDVGGLKLVDARAALTSAGLNVGVVVEVRGCDNTPCDTALATVFRQSPEPVVHNTIAVGGMVDLWLTLGGDQDDGANEEDQP